MSSASYTIIVESSMGEELSRKKRVRAGHKGSTTKMIARVEELLAGTDAPDPLALKQLGMSLREKLDVIKTTWTTFWDSYRSTIHENVELSDIEKFTYLRSLLTHGAADAISGLTLTASNYKEAIQILSKRYGNKQQIVNKRIDTVSSQHDVKGLRRLYDTVDRTFAI